MEYSHKYIILVRRSTILMHKAGLTQPLPSTTVTPLTGTKYYVSCGVGPCFLPADITINVCPNPENNCLTVKVNRRK